MKKIILIPILFLIAGCATPAQHYQFNNIIEVKDSYDNTWSRIVEFFARNQIQIKNIAKDSGIISAEKSSFDQNVADCGTNVFLKPLRQYGLVNVFVKSKNNIQIVTINTEFRLNAINTLDNQVVERKCNSTGNLEHAILIKAGRIE